MVQKKFQLKNIKNIKDKSVTTKSKTKKKEIKYYHWCYKLPAETRLSTRMKSRNNIIKYTSKNADKVVEKSSKDKYTRPANRRLKEYFKVFPLLMNHIYCLWMSRLDNKTDENDKINILDSGAGYGYALVDMLSHNAIKDYIGFATAISMHQFDSMPRLLSTYGEKLEWFINRSQNVLPLLPANRYDIITDLWGAYYYSVDRFVLLEQYYRLLKPGGKAFILCYHSRDNILLSYTPIRYNKNNNNNNNKAEKPKKKSKKFKSFIKFLVRKYPTIFSIGIGKFGSRYLIITKPKSGPSELTLAFNIVKYKMGRRFRSGFGWITFPFSIIVEKST